jgi:O-acetyl-ADP-ribose deacetylase (regulator of RNase III)
MTKVLECSSKGDKRYSAFYAKVKVFDVFDSIEVHYQNCKEFLDLSGDFVFASNWKEAKEWQKQGKMPVRININGLRLPIDYLTPYYKLLWVKYLDANKGLVEYAKQFDEFTDMFRGKNTMNCQADVVAQYVKQGRESIMNECRPLIRLLNKKSFVMEAIGDLLDCPDNLIGHQVNCQGIMGAGLADLIKKKYPHVFEEYKLECQINKRRRVLMGRCQIVEAEFGTKWVSNLFGQFDIGRHEKQTEEDYLRMALEKMKAHAKEFGLTVALPYQLGSGLAGADWKEVRQIIEEVFHDYYVTIYRLPDAK